MKRRKLLAALSAGLAAPLVSFAQQPASFVRVGFLGSVAGDNPIWATRVAAFRSGLRELGYVEGKNLEIVFRWAEDRYERLPALVAELLAQKVDLIVTHATPVALAIQKVSKSVPVVMAVSTDPVKLGLAASLARPGGNFTGTTFFNTELAVKRMELVKDAIAGAKRVAVVTNPDHPDVQLHMSAIEPAARTLKLDMQNFGVKAPEEFERVFDAIAKYRPDAVVQIDEPMLNANSRRAADAAVRLRLRLFGPLETADHGFLIGFGVNFPALFRRAAFFVDRIAKGTKPGDIPFERATKFELAVNQRTARALGVKFSERFMERADKVIE